MNILNNTHPEHAAAMKCVAEFMGWGYCSGWFDHHQGEQWLGSYSASLDTWHAVESRIIERGRVWQINYLTNLSHSCGVSNVSNPWRHEWAMVHATAAQRAEAAWRTLREVTT